jgi:exopolyphosphatase/guanosine-5'-triphosphate,3'-diphosphate pyrophosphatase
MIRASIDLGTNTCLLLITEWNEQEKKIVRVISDHATIVRLGEGVDRNRELQPLPMERTFRCLQEYSKKVREAGGAPETVICVATSQARDAKNSQEFFGRIKKETGFTFRVISGEEEAKLTFLGALLPGMNPSSSAVIDIGGGSTELISLSQAKSIDVGSVRYTERFLKSDPVQDEEFWACQESIDQALQEFVPWRNTLAPDTSLVAVAGTATTLAAWFLELDKFDVSKVDGLLLSRGDIHRRVEELKWRTIEERKKLPGMEPLRADVLLAGALILWRAMELLKFSECRISTRGLRFGVLSLSPS